MYRRLAVLAGGLILLCTTPLAAQDAVLSEMYGNGAHAFFSQDYRQAYDHLTGAVDAGTTDPRCYYFRGLTFLQLGREEEARMDFEKAAGLEAEDVNKFYNVSRALERIQGTTRLMLEDYRAKARVEAMKRAEELRQQRYGELKQAEQRVLEAQAAAAPATPPEVPAAPQPATVADQLGLGPIQATAIGPDDVPAQPAVAMPATAEPAETPAAPAQQGPFGPEPALAADQPGAEPAAGELPADATTSGVFGALGKAISKAVVGEGVPGQGAAPFGDDDPFKMGAPAPAPAQPVAPAEEQPAAPVDDPFKMGAPAPAPAQPAAPAEDLFAPAVPAPGEPAAAGGDPFAPAAGAGQMPAAEESPFFEEKAEEQAASADDDPFAPNPANQ